MSIRPFIITALALVGLVAVSCGGDDDDGAREAQGAAPASAVTVNLRNWAVEPSSRTLAAGIVKFSALHVAEHGAMDMAGQEGATHQLVVSLLPDGAKAGQSKYGLPVLNLADIKPGETKTGEAKLAPGTYELACLVAEEVSGKTVNHYEKGLYTQVTVR